MRIDREIYSVFAVRRGLFPCFTVPVMHPGPEVFRAGFFDGYGGIRTRSVG